MSDQSHLNKIEEIRILNSGSAMFSDVCTQCKHTRSSHQPVGTKTPIAGNNCRVLVCAIPLVKLPENAAKAPGIHYRHSDEHCQLEKCTCGEYGGFRGGN